MLDASRTARLVWRAVRLPSAVIHRSERLLAPALALAQVSGCAKAPLVGKGTLRVVLTATADCNSCGKPSGYPLTYRVLQVTDASPLTGTSLTQVWDKEDKLLGPALLKKTESFIDPGQSKELPLQREKGVTTLVVVGNFCKTRGACWYFVQPLAQGGTVRLTAGSSCFTAAK